MTDREWLESLKEGDWVIVQGSGGHERVRPVTRVTATQIAVGETRYRRSDGHEMGCGTWVFSSLRQANPESVERIRTAERLRALSSRLAGISWRSLPLETLEKIVGLLPENE